VQSKKKKKRKIEEKEEGERKFIKQILRGIFFASLTFW